MRSISLSLIVLLGLVLAALGIASALDLLSLRELLLDMDLGQAFRLADRAHAMVRHRTVQVLELAFGLVGLGLLGAAAWRLKGRRSLRRGTG